MQWERRSTVGTKSGYLVRCNWYLTHKQTLKATQLLRSRLGALVTQLGCHRLCVSASVRSGHDNVEQLSGPKHRICTVQLLRRRRKQMVTLCWYHWCVWKWPKTRTSISLFWHFAAFKERLNWQPIKTKFQYFLTTNGVSCKEFRWEKHLVWVVKVCKSF